MKEVVLGLFVILLGSFGIFDALQEDRRYYKLCNKTGKFVQGKVTSLEKTTSSDELRNRYCAIITFYPNGRKIPISFSSRKRKIKPKWRIGERLSVVYDPENPRIAYIEDELDGITFKKILFSLFLLATGIFMLWVHFQPIA